MVSCGNENEKIDEQRIRNEHLIRGGPGVAENRVVQIDVIGKCCD